MVNLFFIFVISCHKDRSDIQTWKEILMDNNGITDFSHTDEFPSTPGAVKCGERKAVQLAYDHPSFPAHPPHQWRTADGVMDSTL
jgi:hypothetical protein